MILDYMNLEGNTSLDDQLSQVVGLGGGEGVKVVFQLLLGLFVGGCGGGAPVGTVENGGGTNVEEDDGVAGTEVVLDGPVDGVGTLVA